MPTYLVTAYRWGWTNDHQYQVYAGTDKDKAMESAETEVYERGGKYGCAVYEFDDTGEESEMVAYVPSDDENKPSHNWRIDMFERLGHELHRYAEGTMYVPNPDRKGCLKPVPVTPDQWAVDAVQKAEKFATDMTKIQESQMPTITDMQIAKRKLEQDIYLLITDFENEFGVTVAFVGSTHSQEMGGKPQTVRVTVEVRV